MKERLLDTIRSLLLKTVVPIKKKKDEISEKLRFSITFRTAINYTKLFVIYGIIIILLMGFIFLFIFNHENEKKIENIKDKVINAAGDNYKQADFSKVNEYRNDGLEIKILEASTRDVLYSDTEDKINKDANVLDRVYVTGKGSNRQFIILDRKSVKVDYKTEQATLQIEIRFDFSRDVNIYIKSINIIFIIIGLFSVIFSVTGAKQMKFIMQPIANMSEAANMLNGNNLSSKRLNVEGTKNELKDLAETINNMLDRIEISYESQKQFVSDASHELRTPIAVIQGYVNMVDRWGKDDPFVMDEAIEAIKEETQNMKELVEKLLFLSRHDKKTLKLKKEVFNMRDLVDELLKETTMVATNRVVESDALENALVYGDRQSLKQAIRVFVDNAIKYSEDGDKINISCRNDKTKCIVCVSDTGIGMKEKDIQNIFERFYRAEDVRDKSINGHGLGLSIAKLIIQKHTGIIRVRSKYMEGTSFTVELPKIYR